MSVREFEIEDIPFCLEIIKETLTEWDYNQCKKDFEEDYEVYRFVIEDKKKVVGFIGYYPPKHKDVNRTGYDEYLFNIIGSVCLDWFAILPNYQKQGLGRLLVSYCEKHAQKNNKKVIATWTVVPEFFKSCGYKKAIGYDESEDVLYESVLMIKNI